MRKIVSILLFLLTLTNAYSQTSQDRKEYKTEVHFRLGSALLDTTLYQNAYVLDSLTRKMGELLQDSTVSIKQITINSFASPEGEVAYNKKLTQQRTESIYNYLMILPILPDTHIIKRSNGIAWEQFVAIVRESLTPHKEEVIDIIKTVPEETWAKAKPTDRWLSLVDSRVKHLRDLRNGVPYRYMQKHIFPKLRQSSVVTLYYQYKPLVPLVAIEPKIKPMGMTPIELPTLSPITVVPKERKPLFALKTNLLFDAMSIVNLELEVPIRERFSVAGEVIFPWWTQDNGQADSKRNRLQLLNANLEGKFWFGDRTDRPQMTGWFAGLYAGAGLYDLEYQAKGYQGEFFIMGGLSAGYAHTINKAGNLRMEYSLGVGYMQTDYRYYESIYDESYDSPENPESPHWHPVRQNTSRFTWIGPTKLKVSLVWMINAKRKK